jgi:hypothetical protein
MTSDLYDTLDELARAPIFRKSKVIDGQLYLETDASLRRRVRGEDGPVEYRDKPALTP